MLRVIATAAVLTAGLLAFAQAGPSLACSCVVSSLGDNVRRADVVVTGTLTDANDPANGPVISSGDPIVYTVDVDHIYKGRAGGSLVFTSARFGASCGLEGMQVDRRYLFVLSVDGGGRLHADLCGGTRPTTSVLENRLIDVTGPPIAPATGSATPPRPDVDSAARSALPPWFPAASGLAVLAASGGGYIWWRRRTSLRTGVNRGQ